MNKEIITFGFVVLVAGLFYLTSDMNPEDADKQVRTVRRAIARPPRLEPAYEGVHRLQDLVVGRSPDGARRFVDPRERDPLSQPAIGRRLPLPDLSPPDVDRADLAVLSPPPVSPLHWGSWGHLVRAPLVSLPGELREGVADEVARREESRAAAEEAALRDAESGEGSVELTSSTTNGSTEETWEAPDIERLSKDQLLQKIQEVWPTRFGESAFAKVDWLGQAIDALVERDPQGRASNLWAARAALDRLDWDAAYARFRGDALIGADGNGAGAHDVEVMVPWAVLLDLVGLEDQAAAWGLRALDALRTARVDSATRERLWAQLASSLGGAGYDAKLLESAPQAPTTDEGFEATFQLALRRFDMDALRKLGEASAERSGFERLPLVVRLLETLATQSKDGVFSDKARTPELEALETALDAVATEAQALGTAGLELRATARTLQAIARDRNDRLLEARLRVRGPTALDPQESDALRAKRGEMRRRTVLQLTEVIADLVDACQQPTLGSLPRRSHLAYLYLASDLPDEAFAQVEAGLRIDPTHAYLRYVQGLLLLESEDRNGALDTLSRLTEVRPDFLDAVMLTAFVSYTNQDHVRANALLDWVVAYDATYQDAQYLDGLACYVRGQLAQATDHLKKVGQSDRFGYGAQAALGLVQYEERRSLRDLEPVADWFANLRKKIENESRSHPVLRFVQNVELQIGRGANAREFQDDMDRANPVNLFGWDPPMRVPSVQVNMGRWPAEAIEQPGPDADPEKGCLHFYGKFDEKGVAAFWTDRLVLRPADFLSLEADVMVAQGNDALVGMWVGRATRAEGAAPRTDEASFAVGVAFGVDQATDAQGVRSFFNMGGTGADWATPDVDTAATWPVGAPLHLVIESRSSKEGSNQSRVELRILVGGEPVRVNGLDWIPAPQFAQEGRGRAITLAFFAQGQRDQVADFRVDNVRVRYRK